MKKNIYKLIFLSIICSGIIVNSCTKLEDTNYSDLISSEFTPTNADVGALLGAAYGSWRDVLFPSDWGEGQWLVQEMCADELCIAIKPYGWDDGGRHRRMHSHTWTVDDSYINSVWWPSYQGITNCNRVLLQIESLPLDADAKAGMLAEVKILRASFYWVLMDNFGNVPIVDKFDVPEGYLPLQNTRKQVYDFIVKDITESLQNLSNKRDLSTYARFNNKGAANALLAKVYLNAEVYTGTAAWNKCLAACDSIILSGKYDLEARQLDVFKVNNENSKEIVFSVPYDVVYTPNWDIMNLMFDYSLAKQAQETYDLQEQPWGGITAIPQFISTYNPKDKRFTDGWFYGQQYSSSGAILKCNSGLTEHDFNIINEMPGIDSTQEFHGYRIDKYEIQKGGFTSMINNDYVVLRYADVLMMKAECLLRTGHADEAANIVSQVRERSFTDNPELATVTGSELQAGSIYDYGLRDYKLGTTHEGGADIIYGRFLDELGWEFVGEGHRRQDMIRFGVFTTKPFFSHVPQDDHVILFPIPLDELNKNTNLTQNSGY